MRKPNRVYAWLMALLLLPAWSAAADDALPALPDIPAADEVRLSAAANAPGGTLVFTNPMDAGIWPMLPAEEDGVACLTSTNWGRDDSVSAVCTRVDVQAGDVLAFRCKTSMEAGFDVLQICVNGSVVKTFTGERDWQRFAHAFTETGVYEVTFRYVKDSVSAAGADAAYISDVQLLSGDEAVAALAGNPMYPQGTGRLLTVTTPGAQEIIFDDPTFALTMVHGIARYFIVPDGSVQLSAMLDAGDDPDGAVAVIDDDTEAAVLLAGAVAGEAYGFDAPVAEDFTIVSLYPYSGCSTFEMRTVVCFPDAEAVDAYVRLLQENAYLVHGWHALGQTTCQVTVIDQHGEFLEGVTISLLTSDGVELLTSDSDGVITCMITAGETATVHIVNAPEGYTFDNERTWMLNAENPEIIIDLSRIGE